MRLLASQPRRCPVCGGFCRIEGRYLLGGSREQRIPCNGLRVAGDTRWQPARDGRRLADRRRSYQRLWTSRVCRRYSGLVFEDERWFRVRAYNLAGHGHWSAPYRYRHVLAPEPPLPMRRSVRVSNVLTVADATGARGHGRGARVRGDARRRGIGAGDSGLRHGGRYREGGRGLPLGVRNPRVRIGRDVEVDLGHGACRREGRGRRDLHSGPEQRRRRSNCGRRSDGDDRGPRIDAQRMACALRAHHCRPGGGRSGGAGRRHAGRARHGGRHVPRNLDGSRRGEPAPGSDGVPTGRGGRPRTDPHASRDRSFWPAARFISSRRATARYSRRGGALRRTASRPMSTTCAWTAR